jgi:streptogramin lyase
VYVTGGNAEQLSMLKPETTTPTPVFTGITLNGVAVDSGGNVYASDAISRVWRLTAGTDELAALHIEQDPSGVAVDTAGAVYITVTNGTSDGGQVLRLAES